MAAKTLVEEVQPARQHCTSQNVLSARRAKFVWSLFLCQTRPVACRWGDGIHYDCLVIVSLVIVHRHYYIACNL
jgi:hypothetical protein